MPRPLLPPRKQVSSTRRATTRKAHNGESHETASPSRPSRRRSPPAARVRPRDPPRSELRGAPFRLQTAASVPAGRGADGADGEDGRDPLPGRGRPGDRLARGDGADGALLLQLRSPAGPL